MSNEEFMPAFEEYLATQKLPVGLATTRVLDIVRTFAKAIDPVPLDEATPPEVRVFVRDYKHKQRATPVRPLPLSEAFARKRLESAKAELLYPEVRLAMTYFVEFRKL